MTGASAAAGWRRTGLEGEGRMRDIDLFQLALGLVPPWIVVDAKFDVDKKREPALNQIDNMRNAFDPFYDSWVGSS